MRLIVLLGLVASSTLASAAPVPRLQVSAQGLEKPAPGYEPTLVERAESGASRGETLSFVLKLESAGCVGLKLASGALKTELFEMKPVELTAKSFEGAKTGRHYDPLLPLTGGRGCPGWIWVDVQVPRDATPGKHRVSIAPEGGAPVPIDIQVWKQALPAEPSLPIYVNVIPWFIVNGHHGGWHADEALLATRYVREVLKHKIYPMNQHLAPLKLEGGQISMGQGPGSFRAMTLGLLPRESKIFIPIEPRNPEHLAPAYLSAIEAMIKREGLKGRAVSYLWDEPHEGDLDKTEAAARLLRKHAPSLEILVTTAYQRRYNGLVDHFVPVAELFKPADYKNRPFWMYVSCMSHGCGEPPYVGETSGAPDLVIDRASVFARAFPWMLQGVGASAGLYFNTVEAYMRGDKDPWKSTYLFTGNGDGTLLYPDKTKSEPVTSIRLKLLRRGIEDVEYLRMAAKARIPGAGELSKLILGATKFDRELSKYEALRMKIGEALNAK